MIKGASKSEFDGRNFNLSRRNLCALGLIKIILLSLLQKHCSIHYLFFALHLSLSLLFDPLLGIHPTFLALRFTLGTPFLRSSHPPFTSTLHSLF